MNVRQSMSQLRHPMRYAKMEAPRSAPAIVRFADSNAGTMAAPLGGIKGLLKDAPNGILSGIPIEAISASQDYRNGKVKPNAYLGNVLGNSAGWGVWGLGSSLVGAGLLALGAPGFAAGFAGFVVGTVAGTIYTRTLCTPLSKLFSRLIPNGIAKPIADGFTHYIANPLYDHLITPLTRWASGHKIIAGVVGGAAVLFSAFALHAAAPAFARTLGIGLAKVGLKLGAGLAAASAVTHLVLNRFLPEKVQQALGLNKTPANPPLAPGQAPAQPAPTTSQILPITV